MDGSGAHDEGKNLQKDDFVLSEKDMKGAAPLSPSSSDEVQKVGWKAEQRIEVV
jgi:hypothetical protein